MPCNKAAFSPPEKRGFHAVTMEPADLDPLLCELARRLYRLNPEQLEWTEGRLLRLLDLLAHYRRVGQDRHGDNAATGASHLCSADRDPRPLFKP